MDTKLKIIVKTILKVLLTLLFLAIIVVPVIFFIYGIESHPLVEPGEKITLSDADRVNEH